MTPTDKPCLEGCYGCTDHDEQRTYVVHATGCANAPKEPAASEFGGANCSGRNIEDAPSRAPVWCGADEWNSRSFGRVEVKRVPHALNCPARPAPTPEPPKRSLEAMKAEAEAMVKNAFADAREKEARREIMEPPWKPEAEKMAYEALNAAYLALRAELSEAKATIAANTERAFAEMVRLRQVQQATMMAHSTAIGECRKINKAIHRVRRGRDNAIKQLAAERAAREQAEKERDELALLTVPSDGDAQVAVRLRIAEARVGELENEIVSWRGAQAVRFLGDAGDRDAYPRRREAEIKLNEVADSILARSAKGGAKQ